jgi:hypothetical protein
MRTSPDPIPSFEKKKKKPCESMCCGTLLNDFLNSIDRFFNQDPSRTKGLAR